MAITVTNQLPKAQDLAQSYPDMAKMDKRSPDERRENHPRNKRGGGTVSEN